MPGTLYCIDDGLRLAHFACGRIALGALLDLRNGSTAMLRATNNLILQVVLDEVQAADIQVVSPDLDPIAASFQDCTPISVRRQLLQQLGYCYSGSDEELVAWLTESGPLLSYFDCPKSCHLQSPEELQSLFDDDQGLPSSWRRFRERFPYSKGILSLGVPRYNDEGMAVLYVSQVHGARAGIGALWSFRCDGSWRLHKRMGLWIA